MLVFSGWGTEEKWCWMEAVEGVLERSRSGGWPGNELAVGRWIDRYGGWIEGILEIGMPGLADGAELRRVLGKQQVASTIHPSAPVY
jgi:hypothetical protein